MRKPDPTNAKLLIKYMLERLPEKLHGAVADAMKAGFDRLAIEKDFEPCFFPRPPPNLLDTLPLPECKGLPDVVKDDDVTPSNNQESADTPKETAEQKPKGADKASGFDFQW
jgi:hypothetical protein